MNTKLNTNRIKDSAVWSRLSERLTNSIRCNASVPDNAHHPALRDSFPETRKQIERILVPLDGTVFAEHAVPVALGIAEQWGAALQLVHVLVPTEVLTPFEMLHAPDAAIKDKKNRMDLYLSKIAHQISAAASVGVSSAVVLDTDVSHALEETYNGATDLVVMATHGRGPLGRFWWGSVAHSLLQRASVPVVLVQGHDEEVNFTPQSIEHLLLPIDGEKGSARIVEPLISSGLFVGARHTLLHVTRPELKLTAYGEKLRSEWMPSHSREAAGMEYLRPLANSLSQYNRKVEMKVVSSEKPAWQVVSSHANHRKRTMVVCTYRRARLLERVVWPGMSEHLFRAIKGPLMLVPS